VPQSAVDRLEKELNVVEKRSSMPPIARDVLKFIIARKSECGRDTPWEILLCRCDYDFEAGLKYLLSENLIDSNDGRVSFFATPAGHRALRERPVIAALSGVVA
jgi:hypothetical protein